MFRIFELLALIKIQALQRDKSSFQIPKASEKLGQAPWM